MFKPVQIRDGHDNFFTPLRILMALLVVIGHAVVIVKGGPESEPRIFFDYTPSYIAVNLFFIASGFLVTKSMLYRGDPAEYASARILRIYPALIIHVLFIMFIMGPFVTKLPLREFFTDPQFFLQPLKVLTFTETQMVLPGALETNHEPFASAALWTLRYEVLAYIGTMIAFAFGLMRRKWMVLLQFVAFVYAWPIAHLTGLYDQLPATGQSLLRFGICYSLGAVLFAYRDRLKFHFIGIPILGVVTALFHDRASFEILLNVWLGYSLFWAAYVKAPRLNNLQKLNDISYGVYIYHWGIMQWLIYSFPGMGVGDLLVTGTVITVGIAYASWHIVEKPILAMKKPFAKHLRFGRKRPVFSASEVLLD